MFDFCHRQKLVVIRRWFSSSRVREVGRNQTQYLAWSDVSRMKQKIIFSHAFYEALSKMDFEENFLNKPTWTFLSDKYENMFRFLAVAFLC